MDFQDSHAKTCFTFQWIIENFNYCWHKKGECISSPVFIVDALAKTKWSLLIFPKGAEDTEDDFISISLERQHDSNGPKNFKIFCELSFLAVDGSVLVSTNKTKVSFEKDKYSDPGNFVKREEVFKIRRKEFLPGEVLTSRCRMWNGKGGNTKEGHCFARTRIVVERRSFLWNINQFSSMENSKKKIKSLSVGYSIISLKLFPSGGQNTETSIHVEVCANGWTANFVTFRLRFVDTSGNQKECLNDEFTFDDDFQTALFTLNLSKEKLMEKKSLYLPNDVLTLFVQCYFANGTVSEEIEKVSYGCPLSIHEGNLESDDLESKAKSLDSTKLLKEHLESSFKEHLLSDTKLKTTTGRTFPCHKYILSARSPVFKAMFTNDMRENNSDCVLIEDLSDDTVRRMLLYIYTATVQDLQWDSASQLYTAADKYEILSLKKECSAFLKDNLCPEYAYDLLILSDMHQDQDLKSAVQDYVLNHRAIFSINE